MLTNWTEAHSASFQKEIMTFGHELKATGLFTDEALVALLDKHPSHLLDVCTMGDSDHPAYPNKLRTGDFTNCDSQTIIDAAKAGRVWINVRRAMNEHPEYKKALDNMYGSLARQTGNRTFNPKGGILISSPVARVPYHFDKTETILWHIRGRKRIYLYPLTEEFISDLSYESIVSNMLDDDIPYKKEFEASAVIYDLEPGQAITWPMNMPHRVDNQEFCVSVTTEYSTVASGRKNAAMIANAALRSRFGMNPSYSQAGPANRYVKSILGQLIRKTGLEVKPDHTDMVTFKLDPSARDFVVDVEPYERRF